MSHKHTEQELKKLRLSMEDIEAEFKKGVLDENGDLVLSEESHLKIAVLLEQ